MISNRYFPWINLGLIVIFLFIVSKIINKTHLLQKFTVRIKKRLEKKHLLKTMTFEEIVILTGGNSVLKVEIDEKNPLLGQTIAQTRLRDRGVLILMIERKRESISIPSFDTEITLGDHLVCFGQLDTIKHVLGQ